MCIYADSDVYTFAFFVHTAFNLIVYTYVVITRFRLYFLDKVLDDKRVDFMYTLIRRNTL